MTTFEKVQDVIVKRLDGIEKSQITMEAIFRTDLGVDSLDTYELLLALEESLGIQIPDEKANEFVTVGDVVRYIESLDKR